MSTELRSGPTENTPVDLAREPEFALGDIRVVPAASEVVVDGRVEALEPRVLQVLVALSQRRDAVVSREELGARCWDGRVVGDDVLNRCIARLRRLADATGAFTVETIARAGYRLTTESPAPAANQERWRFFAKHPVAVLLTALLAVICAATIGAYLATRGPPGVAAALEVQPAGGR